MKLLSVILRVSNSPSKIRGGEGALKTKDSLFAEISYSSALTGTSPILGEELTISTLFSSNSRFFNQGAAPKNLAP